MNPAPESNYDEEPMYRPPRGPRDPAAGGRRGPPRESFEPGFPPGRYGPGGPDGPADFERRPPRGSRPPDLYPDQAPPRRRRGPPLERPDRGRGYDERGGYEDWPDPRAAPEWEPGRRPSRRSRPPGRAPRHRSSTAPRHRLHWRYRYGALLGIMLFAGICGLCLGFAGLGTSKGIDIRLVLASVLSLLLGLGCAFVYTYF